MDPREQLRRYLEHRREMGERELILDGMSVEDVMRILDAGAGANAAALPPPRRDPVEQRPAASQETRARSDEPSVAADWRDVLRATGSEPTRATAVSRPKPEPEPPPPDDADAPEPDPHAPRPHVTSAPPASARPAPNVSDAPPGIVVGTPSRELFGGALSGIMTVDEIAELVAKCTKCPLYRTATKPVPGQGSATAELVCVGEAPGENEDKSGLAFVGQAGQLLTKILAAINLRREDVFICNVLKHRPPGNRNPMPQEVAACSPYLVRQLEIIRPKVIVAFGTFAAQTLLETKLSIGKLRGSVHKYYGIPLIVTYHPAALLRNPAWKRPTWEDVQLARRVLDRAPGA
jgi:uracil-DNA glycosylase